MAYRRKPYRYKLRYKLLLLSFIGMLIFSLATIFMNKPSTATIIKPSLGDEPAPAETAKTNTITTKYFQLVYDAGLDTVSNISSDDSTALEVYRVARSDTTGRRIFVIVIKDLPAGGAGEESSYKFRHIHPETYRESSQMIGQVQFVLFEKLDGSELTAFAVRGGQMAMLTYSLQTPDGKLYDEAVKLLDNFSWNN